MGIDSCWNYCSTCIVEVEHYLSLCLLIVNMGRASGWTDRQTHNSLGAHMGRGRASGWTDRQTDTHTQLTGCTHG